MNEQSRLQLGFSLLVTIALCLTTKYTAEGVFNFQFECANGRVIPERLRCNEFNDCEDGSDELKCFQAPCLKGQFTCKESKKCIPQSYHCDRQMDCLDGSDEVGCDCTPEQFRCSDGACIAEMFKCDGVQDCSDGSDEGSQNCQQCSDIASKCRDKSQCVPKYSRCNEIDDCADKSDEAKCEKHACNSSTHFPCRSGACILKKYRCDKEKDCDDWSDEKDCSYCLPNFFTCDSGDCVPRTTVCNSIPDCPDRSDETNCKNGAHLLKDKRLEQRFGDKNLVAYSRGYFWRDTHLYTLYSRAWQYEREILGPFGPDPRLYLLMQLDHGKYHKYSLQRKWDKQMTLEDGSACVVNTFRSTDSTTGRNIIECELFEIFHVPDYEFRDITFGVFYRLFSNLGEMIIQMSTETHDYPFEYDGNKLVEYVKYIIFYDVSLYLNQYVEELQEWRAIKENETINGQQIFRTLFLPLYESYGGISIISNFNFLRTLYGRVYLIKYNRSQNLGEIIHFLSGAIGKDISPLVFLNFNLTDSTRTELEKELIDAREELPFFMYSDFMSENDTTENYIPPRNWRKTWRGHSDQLTLAYADKKLAFYFKNFYTFNTSSFTQISSIWEDTMDKYGPLGNDSYLHIVLHDKIFPKKGCVTSNAKAVIDPEFDGRHVIDCGPHVHGRWNLSGTEHLDEIVLEMAKMYLKLSRGHGNWPAKNVSGWSMATIIVYDIYKGRDLRNAELWRTQHLNEKESNDKTHWFRDWYLTIYEGYNGTVVLNNFLDLLHEKWPQVESNYNRQMNMGEFVHFWSGAARKNLLGLAKTFLTLKAKLLEKEFNQARRDIPQLPYSCEDCKDGNTDMVYIVAGISAGILVVILVGFGIKFAMYRSKIAKMRTYIRNLTKEEMNEFYQGNPSLGGNDAHASIHALPFNSIYEIPRDRLVIDDSRVLGTGEFGVVKHGVLKGDPSSGTLDMDVAVKTTKKNVEVSYFKAMLSEIKIMAHIGTHENIASLLGTVTVNIKSCEVLVAMEFCAKGDLKQYLQGNSHKFVDMFDSKKYVYTKDVNIRVPVNPNSAVSYNKNDERISTLNLVDWSLQIASGMVYLNNKNVIHGDLATRNVLITADNIAKVSDFGLSRQLVNYSNYLKKSQTPLPWRWLAIESLTNMAFSVHSDVWSYGVTMWEIFSLGKIPYPGRTWDHDFVDELTAGVRLNSPEFASREIYGIMLDCMKKEPEDRLSFEYAITKLKLIKASISETVESNEMPKMAFKQGGPRVPCGSGKPTGPPVPTKPKGLYQDV